MVERGNHLENLNFRTQEFCNAASVKCHSKVHVYQQGWASMPEAKGQNSKDVTQVRPALSGQREDLYCAHEF